MPNKTANHTKIARAVCVNHSDALLLLLRGGVFGARCDAKLFADLLDTEFLFKLQQLDFLMEVG